MASGSFNISRTAGSTYCSYRVVWSSTADTASNSSQVTVWVYVDKSSSSNAATSGTANTTVTVGSSSQSENGLKFSVSPNSTTLLFAKAGYTVKHADSGAGSTTISVTIGGNVISASGSSTVTLDTIARKATLTKVVGFTDEANPVITYSNPAGNAVTSLQACVSFTGAKDDIAYRDISKTGSSYTFNFTDAERKTLQNYITTGSSRSVYFYIRTIIGSTTYYSYSAVTLSLVNHTPTVSGTAVDIGSRSTVLTGDNTKIIKGYNSVAYTTGAAARKGATITSSYCYNNGVKYTGASGTIQNATNGKFTFSATDSRGNTTDYAEPVNLTVIDYVPLTCNLAASIELDTENTSKATLKITGNYWTGNFGAAENSLVVSYRYKTGDYEFAADDWLAAEATIDTENMTYEAIVEIPDITYTDTCTVQAYANDKVYYDGITTQEIALKTVPVFDWSGEDFNFNVPVTIQGNLLADFIIETYQEDIWYVEKWASGKAVCYGKKNYGSVATSVWGNLYETASLSVDFPSGLFIESPQVFHIDMLYGGAGGWIERGAAAPTKDGITGIAVARNSVSVTYSNLTLGFHIIGKWR